MGCFPPAASVSAAVLPAAPVQPCPESDPGGLSQPTAACCFPQSSVSGVQPNEKCIDGRVAVNRIQIHADDTDDCYKLLTGDTRKSQSWESFRCGVVGK